ncbi:hypothetical protein COX04_01105 [Candidatus Woesebacteria bacterium CG22_combo_CG10-13_8_21_14_all_45_10]|uniref:Glycosyl transferase family 1 domain-containing protein n=1 Tax=Candidatus Woesebacteria bacterium CG22_combo_CG10-13_8_21_14_all_45_10 TaxID=1975060 RepID=A0A2H0BHI5_9BACT|nr:MAG: hypothetical protein COX04_01105 [Candidatus Woesebacteria bacterium CG22_combo_CG10-13_8_21_14_all_45_10]
MKEFKFYFIYVGNAYPHKNLEMLIKVMVLLNKEVKEDVGLAIVSSRGVFTKRLEAVVCRLSADSYIRLLGFVPDEDLTKLYRASVAFVFPSFSEGFGLPGLEAMRAGTLVLTSDIPVFKEIYKENAIYFNPFDIVAIKEAMRTVLGMDTACRAKLIAKSQVFIKRYSWRKMAQETLKVYEDSVGI